jgi:hypothetical protein
VIGLDTVHKSWAISGGQNKRGYTVITPIFLGLSKHHDQFIRGKCTKCVVGENTRESLLECVNLASNAPSDGEFDNEINVFTHIIDRDINISSTRLHVRYLVKMKGYLQLDLAVTRQRKV